MPHERDLAVERHIAMASSRSHTARADLRVAAVDLFLPPEHRLTDQKRALTEGVLDKLVETIEREISRQLIDTLSGRPEFRAISAVLANVNVQRARPLLESSRLLQDGELIAALLRRAEEHRIALAIRECGAQLQHDPVDTLVRDPDTRVARCATQYAVVESRRYDRFHEPLLSRNDMRTDLAHYLYWGVAAALRNALLQELQVESDLLDGAIEKSVQHAMADHMEEHGAVPLALRVAERLNELGRLSDDLMSRLVEHGHILLFTAGLAVRGCIAYDIAWQVVTDPCRMSLAVLLRALDMERTVASMVIGLLEKAEAGLPRLPTGAMAAFDDLDVTRAQVVLRYWQLDVGYRAAIDALGESRT